MICASLYSMSQRAVVVFSRNFLKENEAGTKVKDELSVSGKFSVRLGAQNAGGEC